jgi:hypothetical protein
MDEMERARRFSAVAEARRNAEMPRYEVSALEKLNLKRYRAEQAEKAEKAAAEAIYKTRDGLVRTNFYGDETSDQQDADYTGKDAFVTREQVLELLWAERERSDALLVEALEAVGSTIEAAFDKLERMPDEFETLLTPVKADILQLRARVDLLRSERAGVAPSSDGTVPRRFN